MGYNALTVVIGLVDKAIDATVRALVKMKRVLAPIEVEDYLTNALTLLQRASKLLEKAKKEKDNAKQNR